jgi:hypothetical protein
VPALVPDEPTSVLRLKRAERLLEGSGEIGDGSWGAVDEPGLRCVVRAAVFDVVGVVCATVDSMASLVFDGCKAATPPALVEAMATTRSSDEDCAGAMGSRG